MDLKEVFRSSKPVIGMLHVPALPGAPQNTLRLDEILEWVLNDARILFDAGIDGWILENFGDAPFYPRRTPAHTVAFMTAIAREVKGSFDVALGINVLRNDAESAIAVAAAVDAQFIRVNIHTGARLTDQGLIEGTAHETLRYRKLIGCNVAIFADVDVKHSAPLAARPLEEEVDESLSRGCADAVIVTGAATGQPADLTDLQAAKRAAKEAPVFAGSGIDTANVADVLRIADGLIVGTAFKRAGVTRNPVDPDRVRALLGKIRN